MAYSCKDIENIIRMYVIHLSGWESMCVNMGVCVWTGGVCKVVLIPWGPIFRCFVVVVVVSYEMGQQTQVSKNWRKKGKRS